MPSYRTPSPYDRQPPGRRASGLALAIAINLAVVLALIGAGYRPLPASKPSGALVVDLIAASPAPAPQAARSEERVAPVESRPVAKPPPPPIVIPRKPTITPEVKLDMIELTREEFAAAEIGRIASANKASGAGRPGDSQQAGVGPNGQVLYNAEWVREPTGAELSGYLPRNWREGWGLIACKTIPGNRVDDCIELGQSPRGSRFASAVRQAAWQFRVRPPRKNGRELVGEWVQIRIDYIRE